MCGIVGYVGAKDAKEIVFRALERLEYRGYDSAGIAVCGKDGIKVAKSCGRLGDLEPRLGSLPSSTQAIGHTRWATHGPPSDRNAHPHTDCPGDIALVHNGIIENHRELRERLAASGHQIRSDTDTELAAHLIEEEYHGDLHSAVRSAVGSLVGAMALVVVHAKEPGVIVAFREKSPLIIGLGQEENYLASDIPAILPYTRRMIMLEDGESAVVTKSRVIVYDAQGETVKRDPVEVDLEPEAAERAGFDHFMLKEINEQPEAFRRACASRVQGENIAFLPSEFGLDQDYVHGLSKVYLLGCGTAYHACLVGKHQIERMSGIPAEAALASEFRYSRPIVPKGSLCIAVSQSGETFDTLSAVKLARELGMERVLALTNQPLSSLAREADDVIYQRAGPEISVASTKAYTTQVVILAMIAAQMGHLRNHQPKGEVSTFTREILSLGDKAAAVLERQDTIAKIALDLAKHDNVFFIGRGMDYLAAMEGQLKLKEISYIHAEAYAAGELKHGPLALITPGVPVVACMADRDTSTKTASNIMEARARGGTILAIGTADCMREAELGPNDKAIEIPDTDPLLSPAISVIAMQLLAYHVARTRGLDIDKPRNLAKSVTVE